MHYHFGLNWLGIPLLGRQDGIESEYNRKCGCCTKILDPYGHHSLVCMKTPHRILRHNGIRDIIYNYCKRAGFDCEKEKMVLPQSSERPADIYIDLYKHGNPAVLDVAVTSPLQDKYIREASMDQYYAINDYTKYKVNKWNGYQVANMNYIPFIVDIIGGIGIEGRNLLYELQNAIKAQPGNKYLNVVQEITTKIAFNVIRNNTSIMMVRGRF